MPGKLYSIFRSKCPSCNVGDLYLDPNPYHLEKLSKMHERCSCCGQSYQPETGFFYGAMYVNYAVSVALIMPMLALLYFVFHLNPVIIFSVLILEVIVMYPLIFRWSRNIWLNIFVPYSPEKRRSALAQQAK